MRNIKLTLEYDGSAFFGFQQQPKHPTVQEALEKALSRLFNRKMKIAAASGRTDTGVHAAGQVVNFKTNSPRTVAQIQRGLNGILPRTIAVLEIAEVEDGFHARYSAKSKVYEYRIWNHPVRSPLRMRETYHVPSPLNFDRMRQAARILKGRHDFRSFCSSGGGSNNDSASRPKPASTVRTVKSLILRRKGPLIRIQVEADGFLYHMVRNLVGTLLEVGTGKITLQDLRRILKAKDRTQAGPKVPAHGLSLIAVRYPRELAGGQKE